MKKLLLTAAVLALGAGIASAQPYGLSYGPFDTAVCSVSVNDASRPAYLIMTPPTGFTYFDWVTVQSAATDPLQTVYVNLWLSSTTDSTAGYGVAKMFCQFDSTGVTATQSMASDIQTYSWPIRCKAIHAHGVGATDDIIITGYCRKAP